MTKEELIKHMEAHWDKKENQCKECKEPYLALPWAERKEMYHNFNFERGIISDY